MTLVKSADLLAVGFDNDRSEMWVRFRTRPNLVYVYAAVPREVFQQLLAASSHGRFFHVHVRDVYAVERRDWS
jgi:hypothetical protein